MTGVSTSEVDKEKLVWKPKHGKDQLTGPKRPQTVPPFPKDIASSYSGNGPESKTSKFISKSISNPLVPIGALLTTAALCGGLRAMVKNDSKASQRFMRYRVGAQFFTISAMLVGMLWAGRAYANVGRQSEAK